MAKRTTQIEPKYFGYIRSERVAQREARLLAEQAWAEYAGSAGQAYSPDFENGFVEGFADFAYRGGTGQPPIIPPRGYWNLQHLNRFGRERTKEWYEGFRQGAADCQRRGIREMWVVPTSTLTGKDTPKKETPGDSVWSEPEPKFERPPETRGPKRERLHEPESPPLPDSDLEQFDYDTLIQDGSEAPQRPARSSRSQDDGQALPTPDDLPAGVPNTPTPDPFLPDVVDQQTPAADMPTEPTTQPEADLDEPPADPFQVDLDFAPDSPTAPAEAEPDSMDEDPILDLDDPFSQTQPQPTANRAALANSTLNAPTTPARQASRSAHRRQAAAPAAARRTVGRNRLRQPDPTVPLRRQEVEPMRLVFGSDDAPTAHPVTNRPRRGTPRALTNEDLQRLSHELNSGNKNPSSTNMGNKNTTAAAATIAHRDAATGTDALPALPMEYVSAKQRAARARATMSITDRQPGSKTPQRVAQAGQPTGGSAATRQHWSPTATRAGQLPKLAKSNVATVSYDQAISGPPAPIVNVPVEGQLSPNEQLLESLRVTGDKTETLPPIVNSPPPPPPADDQPAPAVRWRIRD